MVEKLLASVDFEAEMRKDGQTIDQLFAADVGTTYK